MKPKLAIRLLPLLLTLAMPLPVLGQGEPAPGGGSPGADGELQTMQSPAEMLADAHDRAIQELLTASRSEDPLRRMQAIEAAEAVPDRARPLIQLGMEDPSAEVRYAALMTLGKLGLPELGPAAQEMTQDQNLMVRAAAAYAADKCGKATDYAPVIRMLFSREPTERGNAAMILGRSGQRSAIPMLEDAADRPMPKAHPTRQRIIGVQIAEALVRLGQDESLEALRGSAYSQEAEVRIMAVFILGQLEDRSMIGNFVQFLRQDPIQLRLAAASALANIGRSNDVPVLDVLIEGTRSERASVRQQAAFGLAELAQHPRAAAALVSLLQDSDPTARLAAAAAVLRAQSP